MTAEFAAAMPAVAVVLALCLTGVQAGVQQARLQDAAAHTARAIARGDPQPAVVARLGAFVTVDRGDGLLCTRLTAALPGALGAVSAGRLSATSCAADRGA